MVGCGGSWGREKAAEVIAGWREGHGRVVGWGGDVFGAGGEMQQRTLCIIFPFLKNGHEPVSD